jgi:hypothetical protein
MLSITSETITFGAPFTTTITVQSVDSQQQITKSTTIPVVVASIVDPGVKIAVSSGTVVLSGAYKSIIPVTWHWLNNAMLEQTSKTAPEPGTYSKITGVDSPGSLSADCVYTIDGETFTQTVTIPSYNTISDLLKSLLASVK